MKMKDAVATLQNNGYRVSMTNNGYYIRGNGEVIITDSARDVINAAKDSAFSQGLIYADAMLNDDAS
jgi:hypothetical protein